jgi:hypothetical protein
MKLSCEQRERNELSVTAEKYQSLVLNFPQFDGGLKNGTIVSRRMSDEEGEGNQFFKRRCIWIT